MKKKHIIGWSLLAIMGICAMASCTKKKKDWKCNTHTTYYTPMGDVYPGFTSRTYVVDSYTESEIRLYEQQNSSRVDTFINNREIIKTTTTECL